MPRNGSGTYTLPQPAFTAGTVISSAAVNSDLSDIASAITDSLPRDGQAGMTGQFKAADGSVGTPSISFSNDQTTGLFSPAVGQLGISIEGIQVGVFSSSGFSGQVLGGLPVGAWIPYGGSAAPTGFLLCYGQAVLRATYSLLFAAIGTTFGSGDGVTTFNVPDLRGRVEVGKDDMGGVAAGRLTTTYFGSSPVVLGNVGGAESRTILTVNLPSYTPTGSVSGTASVTTNNWVAGNASDSTPINVGGAGSGLACSVNVAPIVSKQPSNGLISAAFSGNNNGGTSTPFSDVQPSIVANKIIFAGV